MAVACKSRSYTKLSLVARLHSTNRAANRLVAKIRSRDAMEDIIPEPLDVASP